MKKKMKRAICSTLLLVFVLVFMSGCANWPDGNWQGEMDMTSIMDDALKSSGLNIDVDPLVVKVNLKMENGKYTTTIAPESIDEFKAWTKDFMGKMFDSLAASSGTTPAKLAKMMGYSSPEAFINAEVEDMGFDKLTKEHVGTYKRNGRELIFDGEEDFPYIFDGDTITGTFDGEQFGLNSNFSVTFTRVD